MKTRTTNIIFQRRKSHLTEIINEKARKGFIPKSISVFGFISYEKGEPDDALYVVEDTTAPRDLRMQDPEQYEKVLSSPKITVFRSLKPDKDVVNTEERSFEGWEYATETRFLSEKASNGLYLSDKKHDEYFFVQGEPDSVEYSIDYTRVVNAQEYLKLFSSDGWHYVCSCGNTHYFMRHKAGTEQVDLTPQLNEIRKGLKTGNIFALQSMTSVIIGACGVVLPIVYGLEIGWKISLGIIGGLVFLSGVATLCMIGASNARLIKRRKLLKYKQNGSKQ